MGQKSQRRRKLKLSDTEVPVCVQLPRLCLCLHLESSGRCPATMFRAFNFTTHVTGKNKSLQRTETESLSQVSLSVRGFHVMHLALHCFS